MSLTIPASLTYHATHRRPAVPFNGRKNVGARKSCGIPAQHREGGPQTPGEGVGDGNEGRPAESFNIDDLNPISIGRKSREVFDDVWAQLQRISSPTKRGDLPGRYLRPEFETPGAKGTKVLVTGVTGRVGRVLLRKLLLRGYTVTALVRQRGGEERQTLPPSVRLVTGDIGNYEDCREAVKDVDKVICCATARTSIVSDLERVDVEGVSNIVRAWQDSQNQRARLKHRLSRFAKLELVHFKKPYIGDDWKVQAAPERSTSAGGTGLSRVMRTAGPKDVADMEINEEGVMTFSGAVYTLYNGVRLTGRPAPSVRTGLHLMDGFIIRARGDGQIYTLTIATEAGEEYTAEWVPPPSYKSVRVALASFKPALESLNVSDITSISIGYNASDQTERSSGRSEFSCSIDWIKCMPGGLEPDFILVSCSGATKGLDETARERVIAAKRRGERALRASGLGYTIVRPGALVEETGGYKALVFDQGTRISQIIKDAKTIIPGGVNSPVRAFKSVGGDPIVFDRVKGAYCWDVDGNKYIDYIGSWGPAIVGAAHDEVTAALHAQLDKGTSFGAPCELENVLARMVVDRVPSVEMVRFVNSGTEACLSVVRLMRAYTKREKILKFVGCYHGHADQFLVQAGSGVITLGLADSPGVMASTAAATLTAPYNDLEAVKAIFEANKGEIAGVILEPVVGNAGYIEPTQEFLEGLREVTKQEGALLCFDEVMTGFRIAHGCAQAHFGVTPDVTTLGKIIGGGLPVGAYGGRRDIMELVAPSGPMYQAGTLSGNPLAMVAGIKTLEILDRPGVYEQLDRVTKRLVEGLLKAARDTGHDMCGGSINGMFGFFFAKGPVHNFEDAKASDTAKFAKFHRGMLERGVYLAPSQFEAGFTSLAHTDEDIDATIAAARDVLQHL